MVEVEALAGAQFRYFVLKDDLFLSGLKVCIEKAQQEGPQVNDVLLNTLCLRRQSWNSQFS